MSLTTTPSLQLSDYLEKLPGTTFRKLYQQPSTAFAIFRRMLPHLGTKSAAETYEEVRMLTGFGIEAKTFVMRILYIPNPMPLSELDIWVKPDAKK